MNILNKECGVIMLATDNTKNPKLFKGNDNKLSFEFRRIPSSMHHLYILSDDEIKEGDWCINLITNNILSYDEILKCYHKIPDSVKKIIATTDTSLDLINKNRFDEINHLNNLGKIITEFKKEYNFIEAYLSIKGHVTKNIHTKLDISCGSEFDNFSMKQVNGISGDLYEDLRTYLKYHNIDKTLIVRDAPKRSWANDGTELVFETSIKV